MPLISVRTPDDGSDWTDERLGYAKNAAVVIKGEHYPIVDGHIDGNSAVLVIDTGANGPNLQAGTATDAGIVE